MSNFIRVLRNTKLCDTREAAITKLEGKLATLQDGEICIASYGATWDAAKTILGVVRLNGGKRSYTIFDNEANSAEIAAEIAKLDATVRGNLTADGAIATDKHVGVKVVEADGKLTEVTVVESDIASAKLLGNLGDASSVDTAFGRIKAEAAARATAITNAINALDSTVAATASVDKKVYSVLTGVTQTDGKLTGVAEVELAAVAKTGKAEDVAKAVIPNDGTYATVEGENVSEQIASIAKTIKGITTTQANALKYATVPLTSDEIKLLENASNVKEAYKVISYTGNDYKTATDKQQVGEVIKIYKDATIHEIYLGNSDDTIDASKGTITKGTIDETKLSLNYAYIKADGTYAIAHIPVNSFLREAEFKNGLHVAENGEVSVKVDTTSEGAENFLSVGQNGVKISGVQTAIGTAIDALNVTKSGTDGKVTVQVAQTKGLISGVTVTTTGLALDNAVVKAVTVNGVNATVTSNKADVTIKGGNIAVADTYTATKYAEKFEEKVTEGDYHIAAGDTIDAALKKAENTISVLATEVISNEKVTTAAVSKLAESAGVLGEGGVIDYVPDTSTTYIKTATSVHDATVKLDAAIKNLGAGALTSLNGSEAITVSGDTANSKTVSLKLDSVKTDNALTVSGDGLYLSNVWDCGTY